MLHDLNSLNIIASFIIFSTLYFLFPCAVQYSAPIQTSRSPAVGSQKIHYIYTPPEMRKL